MHAGEREEQVPVHQDPVQGPDPQCGLLAAGQGDHPGRPPGGGIQILHRPEELLDIENKCVIVIVM